MDIKKVLKLWLNSIKKQFKYPEEDVYTGMNKNTETFNGVTINYDLMGKIAYHKYKEKTFLNFQDARSNKNTSEI